MIAGTALIQVICRVSISSQNPRRLNLRSTTRQAPGGQGAEQPDHLGVDVEQGQAAVAPVGRGQPVVRGHGTGHVHQLILAQQDALGCAGRPARAQEDPAAGPAGGAGGTGAGRGRLGPGSPSRGARTRGRRRPPPAAAPPSASAPVPGGAPGRAGPPPGPPPRCRPGRRRSRAGRAAAPPPGRRAVSRPRPGGGPRPAGAAQPGVGQRPVPAASSRYGASPRRAADWSICSVSTLIPF